MVFHLPFLGLKSSGSDDLPEMSIDPSDTKDEPATSNMIALPHEQAVGSKGYHEA